MQNKTSEQAQLLDLHPFNLALYGSKLGISLEEFWPTIGEEWLDAIRAMAWRGAPQRQSGSEAVAEPSAGAPFDADDPDAILVVEKLWRTQRWGSAYVSFDSLRIHTHLSPRRVRVAVASLIEKNLLLVQGEAGPYSLNPARKTEIERIIHRRLSGA